MTKKNKPPGFMLPESKIAKIAKTIGSLLPESTFPKLSLPPSPIIVFFQNARVFEESYKIWDKEKAKIEVTPIMTVKDISVLCTPIPFCQEILLDEMIKAIENTEKLKSTGNALLEYANGNTPDGYRYFYRVDISNFLRSDEFKDMLMPEDIDHLFIELQISTLKKEDVLLPLERENPFRKLIFHYLGKYIDENGIMPTYHILWDYLAEKGNQRFEGVLIEYLDKYKDKYKVIKYGSTTVDKPAFKERFNGLPIKRQFKTTG